MVLLVQKRSLLTNAEGDGSQLALSPHPTVNKLNFPEGWPQNDSHSIARINVKVSSKACKVTKVRSEAVIFVKTKTVTQVRSTCSTSLNLVERKHIS